MLKVAIRDLALPEPIQAVKRIGNKEFPNKCAEEYADFMEVQVKHNKALVIAHKQLEASLKSANPEVAKQAEAELNEYLDQEVEVKLLPHNLLSQVTGIAPGDLVLLRKLIAEPPCKGVK